MYTKPQKSQRDVGKDKNLESEAQKGNEEDIQTKKAEQKTIGRKREKQTKI